MDDLAVKVGFSFGGDDKKRTDNKYSYKIGGKYYIKNMIPVQVDYSGYSLFLGDMVSVEPGIRYNIGVGNHDDIRVFEFNIGFALHI